MITSVVIRSRGEAPRLRLALASLEGQEGLDEVVVVDDGSTDATAQILDEACTNLPLLALSNRVAEGRSAASNRGAAAASGDVLIFLDGDTLAGPGMVAAHAAAHRVTEKLVGRGETWHLRCTRFLQDPEQGTFQADHSARAGRLSPSDLDALRVTRRQVREEFAAIARRAARGVYPGAAPARLQELEISALQSGTAVRLWAAASGSNLSVRREMFRAAGGFDDALDINEHRELAYRLCLQGGHMGAVMDARTYHLTHRSGWRDPLAETGWEERFRERHPEAPLAELKRYWAGISGHAASTDFFAAS
jgi:glycosyltransferase involved in cell wall biosynthesis